MWFNAFLILSSLIIAGSVDSSRVRRSQGNDIVPTSTESKVYDAYDYDYEDISNYCKSIWSGAKVINYKCYVAISSSADVTSPESRASECKRISQFCLEYTLPEGNFRSQLASVDATILKRFRGITKKDMVYFGKDACNATEDSGNQLGDNGNYAGFFCEITSLGDGIV